MDVVSPTLTDRLSLGLSASDDATHHVSTAFNNGRRGTFWLGGGKFDWCASSEKHPQTIIFLMRPWPSPSCCAPSPSAPRGAG